MVHCVLSPISESAISKCLNRMQISIRIESILRIITCNYMPRVPTTVWFGVFFCAYALMKDNRANCFCMFYCEIEIINKFTFFSLCCRLAANRIHWRLPKSPTTLRVLYLHFNQCQNRRKNGRTHIVVDARTNESISSTQCPTGGAQEVTTQTIFPLARFSFRKNVINIRPWCGCHKGTHSHERTHFHLNYFA